MKVVFSKPSGVFDTSFNIESLSLIEDSEDYGCDALAVSAETGTSSLNMLVPLAKDASEYHINLDCTAKIVLVDANEANEYTVIAADHSTKYRTNSISLSRSLGNDYQDTIGVVIPDDEVIPNIGDTLYICKKIFNKDGEEIYSD